MRVRRVNITHNVVVNLKVHPRLVLHALANFLTGKRC